MWRTWLKSLVSGLNSSPLKEHYKLSGDYNLRILVCVILESFYKDLQEYIKYPYRVERVFYSYGYRVQYLIDFWEKDAELFFAFLYGKEKAKKLMEKLLPQINKAKEIYQESAEYAVQVFSN